MVGLRLLFWTSEGLESCVMADEPQKGGRTNIYTVDSTALSGPEVPAAWESAAAKARAKNRRASI